MMYVAMQDGRLSNPVILEIDPEVIYWQDSKYANMNATRSGAHKGGSLEDFKQIHFESPDLIINNIINYIIELIYKYI